MVRIDGENDDQKLERLIRELCEKHGLELSVEGWSRRTFDVSRCIEHQGRTKHLLGRVESLATTSGEITCYDDSALEFCQELGAALETEFEIAEATITKRHLPHY